MRLKDSVFVVTGGGNGIAREVVLRLLAEGARVAAVDVSAKGLAETATLADAGDRLTTDVVDITNRDAVGALADAVIATHGQVDGVANIAGIIHRFAPVTDLGFEEFERVMTVNFWGTLNVTKTFLPHLLARPAASLLNFASMGALTPVPGQSAYGASKAAVKLLTEGLYAELQGTNVAVSIVFPGGVSTNITGNSGVAIPGEGTAALVNTAKLISTTPQQAAEQVVTAIAKGTFRVVVGRDAAAVDRLGRLSPRRAIIAIANRMNAVLA